MPFTICDDGSRLKFGGRRRDHFVTFHVPELHDCIGFAYNHAVQDPQLSLPYFGRKLPPRSNQFNWEVEFVSDDDFKYRDFFEKWCNNINHGIWKTETATVQQYTKIGEPVGDPVETPPLIPINISSMDLDWSANDSIEKFTVTFLVNPLPFDAVEELP